MVDLGNFWSVPPICFQFGFDVFFYFLVSVLDKMRFVVKGKCEKDSVVHKNNN